MPVKFWLAMFALSPLWLPVAIVGAVVLFFVWLLCESLEAAQHRNHPEADPLGHVFCAPGCLRCARRSIHGEDSPAGRYL